MCIEEPTQKIQEMSYCAQGARQHGYKEYNRSQRSRARGGGHVPRASGDASGSACGGVALLLAGRLLDIMAGGGSAGEMERGEARPRAGVVLGQAMLGEMRRGEGRG